MIRLAIGVPGAGKSICLQDCAREAVRKGWPVFAVDRAGEWLSDANVRWRNNAPNVKDILSPTDWDNAKEEGIEAGVYAFNGFESLDVARYAQAIGNVVFVDDEIDISAPLSGKWKDNPLRDFCHRGRHFPNAKGEICELHLWGAARRIQNVHTDVTSLCDEAFVFRVSGRRTIDRIIEEMAFSEEQANEALTLDTFNYFRWSSKGTLTRGFLTPLPKDEKSTDRKAP